MSDELDTLLVEFRCRVEKKDEPGSPIGEFEQYLRGQDRAFAVEEFIVKKENVTNDADWSQWFEDNSNEGRAFAAVFLVKKKDKEYFDVLVVRFMDEGKERAKNTTAKV
jgi:squalene cyclase